MGKTVFSVVIPVFNEEEVIQESYKRLKQVMDSTQEKYEIIFINDGSKDQTLELLEKIQSKDKDCKVINFSRNFGHQMAITAGMDHARGEAVVVIDADLQDPPEVILQMIEKWKQGYHVVYGKRSKRKGETLFKRLTASFFYRSLNRLTDVKIPLDVGDFRLLDRKICDVMKRIHERNRFVRGLVSWMGFKQTSVEYVRKERWAGKTKYPLTKMLRFAFNAIFSFSDRPLKIATFFGSSVSFAGFIYLLYILYLRLFTERTVQGWTSIVSLTLIFNGITLLFLGIIGEYIGRIYDEAKNRPPYIVQDKIGFEEKKDDE